MTHQIDECPIQRKYFDMIKNGRKTIEGRINSHPFTKWHENQEVRFKNGSDFVRCKIVRMTAYKTFEAMLNFEGYTSCIPDARSLKEAVDIYQKIPNYPSKEKQSGVLAIQIQVIGDV
jgi:ASC-1-like (ASCH) protein